MKTGRDTRFGESAVGEFELDQASVEALAEADAAIERGEGITLQELMDRLRRFASQADAT